MTRNWKLFGLPLVLAGAVAAPAAAADPELPKKTDLTTITLNLQELTRKVDALSTKVDGLASKQSLEALRQSVDRVELNGKYYKDEIADLRRQVDSLHKAIDALARGPESQVAAKAGPAPSGRVKLVNTWFEPMTVVVNGKAYRVGPGEEQTTEPLPAGRFSYEVLAVSPGPQERPLAPDETYTVRIYPR